MLGFNCVANSLFKLLPTSLIMYNALTSFSIMLCNMQSTCVHIGHCAENSRPATRLQKTDGGKMMVQRAEDDRGRVHPTYTDGQSLQSFLGSLCTSICNLI